ncbi:MATE family efflux transporter [Aliidiomarina quisquiliarum]|uniref:MATE family efflux transporter n=1 Tax=Aliidiomarina quisquiliarum TaxID=2938947 RepID=UPI00208E51D9|nr:MATE family efflux transporter [Aliidiomarina quisquiliarum]MCO4321598.1 MATE family efflux transporter [Aliidiomarina quisquiliarum]
MVFGAFALMGFQLVDSIFISRLGVAPLAALGFTVPVYQLMVGFQVGVGIAATALIARALGAKQSKQAKQLAAMVVVAGGLLMLLLCLLIWFFQVVILQALGAESALLPLINSYWLVWLFSSWLGAMLYFAYSICRANGDTRLPGLMMVVTSLINLVLDPLFILTFGWGLVGAALATWVAFAVGAIVVYGRLFQRGWLDFDLASLPPVVALRQLSSISAPAMLSQLMPGMAALLATALIASFGASAVAAWALGTRLEFFSLVLVLALTMSLPPMVGHFLGAGELEKIQALIRLAVRFVLLFQLGVALMWLIASRWLPSVLTPDAQVGSLLANYLLLVPLSYGSLGVTMIMVSVCNALGWPLRAVLISCLRLFVFYLPALWLGAYVAEMPGVFVGVLGGNLLAGISAWRLYQHAMRRLQKDSYPSSATG